MNSMTERQETEAWVQGAIRSVRAALESLSLATTERDIEDSRDWLAAAEADLAEARAARCAATTRDSNDEN